MAMIVSRAYQGNDHLWQEMGLWSRDQLSALMLRNFPSLAQRNMQDMKWKKFIYKQLCDAEGIYTCRAKSVQITLTVSDRKSSAERPLLTLQPTKSIC